MKRRGCESSPYRPTPEGTLPSRCDTRMSVVCSSSRSTRFHSQPALRSRSTRAPQAPRSKCRISFVALPVPSGSKRSHAPNWRGGRGELRFLVGFEGRWGRVGSEEKLGRRRRSLSKRRSRRRRKGRRRWRNGTCFVAVVRSNRRRNGGVEVDFARTLAAQGGA
jgi:hypothetical protein